MWRALIVSLALICLVLLGWYAIKKYPGRIEASLATRAKAAVVGKVPGVTVQASQRDLVLSGRVDTADDKARAETLALEVSGVKSVVNQLEVGAASTLGPKPEPKADPQPQAELKPEPKPEPTPEPNEPDVAASDVVEAAEVAPDVVEAGPDEGADTAQPDTEPAAAIADVQPEPVAVKTPGGALTPAQCKEVIASMIEGPNRIVFQSNTGKLTDEGHTRLAQVWAVLQRCPSAGGVIEAYHDDHGDPDKVKTLTQIRAYNTHRRLIEMGMDEKRFRYVGFGYRNMRYRKPGERLLNQRIEFNITVE